MLSEDYLKDTHFGLAAPHSLKELDILKPFINSVKLDKYGKELAVAVDGENLWFCSQVSVGGYSMKLSDLQLITGSGIQFNIPSKPFLIDVVKNDNATKVGERTETTKVILHTCFSAKPTKANVLIHQKVS